MCSTVSENHKSQASRDKQEPKNQITSTKYQTRTKSQEPNSKQEATGPVESSTLGPPIRSLLAIMELGFPSCLKFAVYLFGSCLDLVILLLGTCLLFGACHLELARRAAKRRAV
jgi:hypothetical protein